MLKILQLTLMIYCGYKIFKSQEDIEEIKWIMYFVLIANGL